MGEAHGWHSREAVHAAMLLTRLELPDASPWFIAKRAETILNLYAALEEHRDEPEHPHVRDAVRDLDSLKKMSFEDERPGSSRRPSFSRHTAAEPPLSDSEETRPAAQEASEERREPWWRRWLSG